MAKLKKTVPPYAGNEPYMYFCFSKDDEARVRPLLQSLYKRGCRIWYNTEKAGNKKEYDAISNRIAAASLTVLFLTDRACSDTSLKNDVKYSFRKGTSLIIFRADRINGNLSLGLPENIPCAESEEELLRTEGFHAGLIGAPPRRKNTFLKILTAFFLALSAAVCILAALKIGRGEPLISKPEDVVELKLSSLPESAEELEMYPNLEKLIVPQSIAAEALERFEDYVIVLAEG